MIYAFLIAAVIVLIWVITYTVWLVADYISKDDDLD